MKNSQLALILDADALIQGLDNGDAYSRAPIKIRSLLDSLESNCGKVTLRIAVADWSSPRLRKLAADLAKNNFEMIHCFKSFASKSTPTANLMTIKAMDAISRNPSLDTLAVNSQDGELASLITYIHSTGRETIFIYQDKNNCPPVANLCDATLLWPAQNTTVPGKGNEKEAILRTLRGLVVSQGVYLDVLEDEIMDHSPDFKPESYGFSNLYELLKSFPQYFRIEDKADGLMVYPASRPSAPRSDSSTADQDARNLAALPLQEYMYQTRWYIPNGPIREQLLANIYNVFAAEPGLMLKSIELRNECVEDDMNIDDRAWQGTVFSLVCGFCLWERNENTEIPQAYRKLALHKSVTSLDDFILKYYVSLFHKAYSERPDLTAEEMTRLMYPEDMEGHLHLFEDVLATLATPQP